MNNDHRKLWVLWVNLIHTIPISVCILGCVHVQRYLTNELDHGLAVDTRSCVRKRHEYLVGTPRYYSYMCPNKNQ